MKKASTSLTNSDFYAKAKRQYEERFRQHQTIQARSRAFTQDADPTFGGYLSCVNRPAIEAAGEVYPQPLAETEKFFLTHRKPSTSMRKTGKGIPTLRPPVVMGKASRLKPSSITISPTILIPPSSYLIHMAI